MMFTLVSTIALYLTLVTALPTSLGKREVPQEHSHQQFITTVTNTLQKNNPAEIVDPIFGLLGNGAAKSGLGKITDTECLQQATADQAFTNAKAANDVTGMTAALIYRALERNTGKVGLASNSCVSIKAVNPQIAAVKQHQDPASSGAAATNKAIVLELAKQIASIGGNPQDALKSGTFKPGSLSDNSGKGNTCDTASDPIGCIFSQNLLVDDATAQEVADAAGGTAPANGDAGSGSSAGSGAATTTTSSDEEDPTECTAEDSASTSPATAAANPTGAPTTSSTASAPYGNSSSHPIASPSSGSASATKLSLGSCSDATVKFADGLDGRTEPAFEPNDQTDFPHGSALNLQVISAFICQQLNDKCKAASAAVTACNQAAVTANSLSGQAAADAFNAVFA